MTPVPLTYLFSLNPYCPYVCPTGLMDINYDIAPAVVLIVSLAAMPIMGTIDDDLHAMRRQHTYIDVGPADHTAGDAGHTPRR
jgi:hypothetical protein